MNAKAKDLLGSTWNLTGCTEEQKAEWQKYMFSLGFSWNTGSNEVINLGRENFFSVAANGISHGSYPLPNKKKYNWLKDFSRS